MNAQRRCRLVGFSLLLLIGAACEGDNGGADEGPIPITDAGSPELRAAYREALDVTPVPPNGIATRIDWSRNVPIERSRVLGLVQYDAHCDWYSYWLAMRERGDAAAVQEAEKAIKEIPTWPSFRGTGFETEFRRIADAVSVGDALTVRAQFPGEGEAVGNCPTVQLDNYRGA